MDSLSPIAKKLAPQLETMSDGVNYTKLIQTRSLHPDHIDTIEAVAALGNHTQKLGYILNSLGMADPEKIEPGMRKFGRQVTRSSSMEH